MEFLRFAAALGVVVYHAGLELRAFFQPAQVEPLLVWTWIGNAGVPVFFTISGFIMLHGMHGGFGHPGSAWRFLLRRLLRIYPIYWIALLAYLLALPPGRAAMPADGAEALATALLLPGHAARVITPAWTLSFEMFFYLAFAAALLLPRRAGLGLLGAFFLAGIALGQAGALGESAPARLAGSPLLLEFLAGIGIALALQRRRLAARLSRPAALRAMLWGALALFLLSPLADRAGLPAVLHMGVPALLLVAWAVFAEAGGRLGPAVRWLSRFGSGSYALYLIHILVLALLLPLAGALADAGGRPLAVLLLLTALAFLAGEALHRLLERPLLRVLRRRLAGAGGAGKPPPRAPLRPPVG